MIDIENSASRPESKNTAKKLNYLKGPTDLWR